MLGKSNGDACDLITIESSHHSTTVMQLWTSVPLSAGRQYDSAELDASHVVAFGMHCVESKKWIQRLPDGRRGRVQLRDLRLLDPMLATSYPSALLARDEALVLNLEFIKAVITPQAVLVLNPGALLRSPPLFGPHMSCLAAL